MVAMALALAGCGSAARTTAPPPAPPPPTLQSDRAATVSQLGPWHLVGHQTQFGPASNQGLATVDGAVTYRGDLSIQAAQAAQGWDHVGDPDAWRGTLVTPYQGGPGATSKMFLVSTAAGVSDEYVHPLDPGELANNSFAAIAPDGQWMVSGEWETMNRLLVWPTPGVNPEASPSGGPLARVGSIALDHPVRDVQGCAFVTATRLLCSSADHATDLWPTADQLFQVQLPAPLDGHGVTGHVTDLGSLPQTSACAGPFEPEGIDYDPTARILRVEVSPPPPCNLVTTIYDYRQT